MNDRHLVLEADLSPCPFTLIQSPSGAPKLCVVTTLPASNKSLFNLLLKVVQKIKWHLVKQFH